ncbi:MAG: hypothetical protein HYX79_09190 [Chloroflexi bacterium]|nr:hypothetical protein [Chloroflexota bacterium]
MDIIVKLVERKIPLDEIKNLPSEEPYWLFLGKKPLSTNNGDRAYIYHKRAILGYLSYKGYEEQESRDSDFTKWAFKFSGPFLSIEPIRIDLPSSWRWRYVEKVSGLRELLDKAVIRDV